MPRYLFLLFFISICLCGPATAGDNDDILKIVLDSVGFDRYDLGYQPKGYWSRFPNDIPHKLGSFDDLFAEPLKLYDYGKTMAGAAEKYMDPAFLDTSSLALYYLTYSLGVDRKLGGFRNYSPNLLNITDSAHPISEAVDSMIALSRHDKLLFGSSIPISIDVYMTGAAETESTLPDKEKLIIGKLLLNLCESIKWRNIALRNCDPEKMKKIFEIEDLALTQSDGNVYYPEIDDVARTIDYPSMHYAALMAAAIVQETADSISFYKDSIEFFDFYLPTPYGAVVLAGNDKMNLDRSDIGTSLASIDIGDAPFLDPLGCNTALAPPVSVHIDICGDDIYEGNNSYSSLGSGVLGIGILYDAAGDDIYLGKRRTQGFGLFGIGILFDKDGNDKYEAELSGQGCGYFGIGLCFDAAGIDSFYIYGNGQGYGGVGGGIGVLADYAGDDFYKGEPSPEIFDMADYHSKHKINGNGVQGVGFGRRGDMTDGHSWAGGMGAIVDIGGDDHYLSGNWSLGCAYWFSTGIAYDGAGDDVYESCYFTQGSGAHFCNGILIDEGGHDRHELYETAGAALGFGWDYTNAILVNIGGDDSYMAEMISMGCAEIRSNAFLIDIGGDDSYLLKKGALGLGAVDFREYYTRPTPLVTYYSDSKSLGAFIDIGGDDSYISFDDSASVEHETASNDKFWFIPSRTDSTFGYDNYGVGIDIDSGVIPELERWK